MILHLLQMLLSHSINSIQTVMQHHPHDDDYSLTSIFSNHLTSYSISLSLYLFLFSPSHLMMRPDVHPFISIHESSTFTTPAVGVRGTHDDDEEEDNEWYWMVFDDDEDDDAASVQKVSSLSFSSQLLIICRHHEESNPSIGMMWKMTKREDDVNLWNTQKDNDDVSWCLNGMYPLKRNLVEKSQHERPLVLMRISSKSQKETQMTTKRWGGRTS